MRLWDGSTGSLLRRYRQGDAAVAAYAEDYAYLIFGLLELFQAGGDPQWLEWAIALQRRQDELFWDPAGGGWFGTTGGDPSVILRLKEDYDGAEPAASSIGAHNVLVLAHLTAEPAWAERLVDTLRMFAPRVAAGGRMVPMCMAVLSLYRAGIAEVVVSGDADDPSYAGMLAEVRRGYRPAAVLIPIVPATRERLAALLPWTRAMHAADGRPAAYVCRDFTCRMPAHSSDELAARFA
jgi:uncharacterized protein YyaL (SSP411 family)